MPNMTGGKGYKKGSHEPSKLPECDWDDGQQYGRILRALGNRRFRVICNDMKERICKLAGNLRRSQWCEEGTFVILSLRGLAAGGNSSEEVGDILKVIEQSFVSKLKKDNKINKQLFGITTNNTAGKSEREQDDLFESNDNDNNNLNDKEEESESEEETDTDGKVKTVEEKEQDKKNKTNAREKKNKERDQQRSVRRDAKNEDDIDIDAI